MPLDFPAFRPHPLIRGGHLQTIIGCCLPGRTDVEGILHHVPLWDGDWIALHDDGPQPRPLAGTEPGPGMSMDPRLAAHRELLAPGYCPGAPVAILVHGLGGCHQSGYMQRCSAKLRSRGVRVFRMDLRGCGAGLTLARQTFHAGRSDDAAAALAYVARQCPDSPIHLVGYSLGANIVLKLAGELGGDAPACLASVMAVCPPIDLVECSRNMERGLNGLYDRSFVRGLIRHVQRRSRAMPDAHSRPLVPLPRRLVEFDNAFTAPLAGFADAHDYYTRASSGPLLGRIAVPTLIVAAASDPIVPIRPLERASYSPTTQLAITPCGGHLGFLAARSSDPDRRWLDWRVVEWVTSHEVHRTSCPRESRPSRTKSTLPA